MNHPALDLIKQLIVTPATVSISPRLIYPHTTWEVDQLPEVDLTMLGFNHRAKMNQLKRNYWNPEAAQDVVDRLQQRKSLAFTSLSLSMRGGVKDSRSQGWCMEAAIFRSYRKSLSVTMLYRTTEVIQKFAADLAFLGWVFEEMRLEPEHVSFALANCYVSGVFLPALFQYEDPVDFLEWAEEEAPAFYKLALPYFYNRYHDKDVIPTYSPAKRQHRLGWTKSPKMMKKTSQWIKRRL